MSNLDGLGYRGKTVVVTGAASGMGEATARILSELGAQVHAVDLNQPKVPHAAFYQTDLTQPEQVSNTAAALRDHASKEGPIHFVFACAGVPQSASPMVCMQVNYIGTRQLVEALLPAVEDRGGIAIIASDAALAWQKNLAQNLELLAINDPVAARAWCEKNPDKVRDGYTTSKEMLTIWVQHSAIELGKRGIRINCTWPCPTGTAFMDKAGLSQQFLDDWPYPLLGRMATAEEQAWPLVLLNSPLNSVVTGAVLYTNQGFVGGLLTGSLDASTLPLSQTLK